MTTGDFSCKFDLWDHVFVELRRSISKKRKTCSEKALEHEIILTCVNTQTKQALLKHYEKKLCTFNKLFHLV